MYEKGDGSSEEKRETYSLHVTSFQLIRALFSVRSETEEA